MYPDCSVIASCCDFRSRIRLTSSHCRFLCGSVTQNRLDCPFRNIMVDCTQKNDIFVKVMWMRRRTCEQEYEQGGTKRDRNILRENIRFSFCIPLRLYDVRISHNTFTAHGETRAPAPQFHFSGIASRERQQQNSL